MFPKWKFKTPFEQKFKRISLVATFDKISKRKKEKEVQLDTSEFWSLSSAIRTQSKYKVSRFLDFESFLFPHKYSDHFFKNHFFGGDSGSLNTDISGDRWNLIAVRGSKAKSAPLLRNQRTTRRTVWLANLILIRNRG